MKLSLVIPAYNEAARIEQSLERVAQFLGSAAGAAEVIIVNDGSRDDTAERVRRQIAGRENYRLLEFPENRGKGAAVQAGVAVSRGERILMTDADLSTPLTELAKLAAALDQGCDLAVGSRQIAGATLLRRQPWLRQRAGLLFGSAVRALLPVGVMDTQCGFKLLRGPVGRELFARLSVPGFVFDVELLVMAQAWGLRVAEIPVTWENVEGSKVSLLGDLPRVTAEILAIRRRWRAGGYAR